MRKFFATIIGLLVLTSCSGSGGNITELQVTTVPPQEKLDESYVRVTHDLSPFKEYQFAIVIPQMWETSDTKIELQPNPDQLTEMAHFRPFDSGEVDTNAELALYVFKPSTDIVVATWLKDFVTQYVADYKIESELVRKPETLDLMVRYNFEGNEYVSRWYAFKNNDRVVLIVGSAKSKDFEKYAEAFFVGQESIEFVK